MIRRRMPIVLPPFQDRLSKAVAHYWRALEDQTRKQKVGMDHGRRKLENLEPAWGLVP